MQPFDFRSGIPMRVGGAMRVAAAGTAAAIRTLGFAMETQLQSNWCWTATGTSVARHFNGASAWTQCSLADAELGRHDCCGGGASDAAKCNKPWYLQTTLRRVGHLSSYDAVSASFARVRQEIDASRLLGCRTGWAQGGGHFVVVDSYSVSDATEQVDVRDPIYGTSTYDYDAFRDRYRGSGRWTHSYYTQP